MFSATAARYSAILGDGLRTLASRQIDIKTSRPLRKIAQRRVVLGALQKYGEVVAFQHVKPPNQDAAPHGRILAIFDTADAASKAIDASPLKIALHNESATNTNIQTNDQIVLVEEECEIEISRSKVDHYNEFIRKNPYYGPWTMDYSDKRVSDIINTGAPRHELADCFPVSKQGALATSTIRQAEMLDRDKEGVDRNMDGDLEEVLARSLAEILKQRGGQ